jgi:hypothetical protein
MRKPLTRKPLTSPNRGEAHYKAQLTEETVREARKRWDGGASLRALAREYGVHVNTIRDAILGISWKHVR